MRNTHANRSGEVRLRVEIDLASRIGGKIVTRSVDVGARVTKGRWIERFDTAARRAAPVRDAATRVE